MSYWGRSRSVVRIVCLFEANATNDQHQHPPGARSNRTRGLFDGWWRLRSLGKLLSAYRTDCHSKAVVRVAEGSGLVRWSKGGRDVPVAASLGSGLVLSVSSAFMPVQRKSCMTRVSQRRMIGDIQG